MASISSAAASALGLGHLADHQAIGDVLRHGHMGEQGVVLEHGVDVALIGRHAGHGAAVDQHLARGRLLEAGDQPQAGGLARARRPQHGEELAVGDVEADVVDGPHLAVVPADLAEGDGARRGFSAMMANVRQSAAGGLGRARPPDAHWPLWIAR